MIQRVGVVDHAEQRGFATRRREQAERRRSDVEATDALRLVQREGATERGCLDRWEVPEPIEKREHQLVQTGIGELGFGSHAHGLHDPSVLRTRYGVAEQRALADAGLTADDERPAATRAGLVEELIDAGTFTLSAEQHALSLHQCND
jgi:hypothetical protein